MTDILHPSIFHLLASAKENVGAVAKKEKNQSQHFNFRGIDAVVNAVAPVFNELGIINVPEVLEHEYETVVIGSKQTQMGHVSLVVKYTFYGPEGDSVAATVASEAMDAGDKAVAKAMSVAYRTALLQVLNLPTDEPDPDATSYERASSSAAGAKSSLPWDEQIYGALTVADLRKVWKNAGAAGVLTQQVADRNGVALTVQELLLQRNDEISFQDDPEGSRAAG
jgi:ERF superfamily